MGEDDDHCDDDRTVSDVAFGSLRYWRMGGMGIGWGADRVISCTYGSVTALPGVGSEPILEWNMA